MTADSIQRQAPLPAAPQAEAAAGAPRARAGTQPMRILVACDIAPYPLTNGQNLRIFHYVRELRARHAFDLVYLGVGAPAPELTPLFGSIDVLPPFDTPAQDSMLARLNLSGNQLVIPHPSLARRLTELARSGRYDLIWFSGGGTMNPHLADSFGVPVLADVVDSMTLIQLREFRRARRWVDRLRQGKRLIATYLFERKVFRDANLAMFVADTDATLFGRICPTTPTRVVQNGVDEQMFRPQGPRSRDAVIAFEGNMGFGPNIDAAQWLCHNVAPLLWRVRPELRVLIIGKDPDERVRRLAGAQVEVTGTVDDVRPSLRRAAVFVCPMQSGAGIKNKILQAWAMGMPTVATPLATGGLEARPGENILVEEDAEGFAKAVIRLLGDPELADRIGDAARATIVDGYSWTAKANEIEQVFEETVKRAATRPHA